MSTAEAMSESTKCAIGISLAVPPIDSISVFLLEADVADPYGRRRRSSNVSRRSPGPTPPPILPEFFADLLLAPRSRPVTGNGIQRSSGQEAPDVECRDVQDAVDRFSAVPGHVRGEDHILMPGQGVPGEQLPHPFLRLGNVEHLPFFHEKLLALDAAQTGTSQPAALKRLQERSRVHQGAARGVDEQRSGLHYRQAVTVD